MGTIHVLDHTGHTDIAWDTQVEEEVTTAREKFAQLLLEGRLAFSNEGQVKEWDSKIEELTIIPRMVGG